MYSKKLQLRVIREIFEISLFVDDIIYRRFAIHHEDSQ